MEKISIEVANMLLRKKGFEIKPTNTERHTILETELEEYRKGEISDYIDYFSSHLNQMDTNRLFDLVDDIYVVAKKAYDFSGECTFNQCITSAINQIVKENF